MQLLRDVKHIEVQASLLPGSENYIYETPVIV